MRFAWTLILLASVCLVGAEQEKNTEITKLDVLDLTEAETADHADSAKDTDVQRKRDSGYSYNRPDRFTSRPRPQQSAYKGRIVTRPVQINRPATKYGPPGQQAPLARPNSQQNKFHQQQFNQQQPNNGNSRPFFQQEVPSPIRNYEFSEPNPIASQNNEPFGSDTANYLPPRNQKLPGYTNPQSFAPGFQETGLVNVQQGQSLVQQPQDQQQISDAALFLSENAHAIQQLYGASATEQDFAPNNDQFPGNTNQAPSGQLQGFDTGPRFNGQLQLQLQLPSYASGTLNTQESLEQIQNLEKDRLIVQLQRALALQSQTEANPGGRYAQNQPSFVQGQGFMASLGQGTTRIPLSYGLPATAQPPTFVPTTPTTTTTTTTTPSPGVQQGSKGDGTNQVGASLPPPTVPQQPAVPVYGGFVPLIPGTSFLGVPTYGPGLLSPGAVQPSATSPTHFGIPIPVDHGQKPTLATPGQPAGQPGQPAGQPGQPGQPVQPAHPVTTPLHPITPLQPVIPGGQTPVTAVQTPTYGVQTPITGVQTSITGVQTPVTAVQTPTYGVQAPTYGVQTPQATIGQVFYKPIKPVYPVYYYPNVALQLQKPALSPVYPWSYAPAYAQAKPAQIWK